MKEGYIRISVALLSVFLSAAVLSILNAQTDDPGHGPKTAAELVPPAPKVALPEDNLINQSREEARAKSAGCVQCHEGIEKMHQSPQVVLGCVDCHGGNPALNLTEEEAHVQPEHPEFWKSSANPVNSSTLLNRESPEFIQFVNPGDLRVASKACGQCHQDIVDRVGHSMMNHGAMLWGAALYNNGAYHAKNYVFGQAYGPHGEALRLNSPIEVTPEMTREQGILPYLDPLPRFQFSQPGNVLRIFEKGGEILLEIGNPNPFEPPGRPIRRLSERGLGTGNRTDPVWLGLQKTRLHDPLLGFMGSNEHPGDYRSSGCTACHTVYANDRSPSNSAWYAQYGHQGLSYSEDPTIPKDERGHPIKHQFTRSIPSSQCMNCHMHQGNLFVNSYLGFTWWDQESDGEHMYPEEQKKVTPNDIARAVRKNPSEAAARGNWIDLEFLEKVSELNPKLNHTQFADYHGHGWVFRAVFKKDREGNLLDKKDQIIPHDDLEKFAKAVHLKDIHVEKGMQCADCHFEVDVHGNGLLYGEPRNATTIECIDCHGTAQERPTLITSGKGGQIDLNRSATPWGPRFFWKGKRLFQRSIMSPDVTWEVTQTVDTLDPESPHYNAKSHYAKTLQRDGETWGEIPDEDEDCARVLAHNQKDMSCQVCHSSWATSCFGCHLPLKTNSYQPTNKFEGSASRFYTSYNPQVVRDDVFMLGLDGTVKDNQLAVIRSSSAVVVSSQNTTREWIYAQQQTISAEGYSGQAFNPHFPHTTSGVGTTKNCTDCHLSKDNDNNAIMAQLLGFGTGTVNFFGRYAYVAVYDKGVYAIPWTTRTEPQAALGSFLHSIAYPADYEKHVGIDRELTESHHHHGHDTLKQISNIISGKHAKLIDIQRRGEFLYTAAGTGGFEVLDISTIDNKGFAERMVSAPFSPLGWKTYVRTKYATAVVLPSTLANDPARVRYPENEEQPIHMLYAYAYIMDKEEGLVMVNVATLLDGNPRNNFLKRDVTFNPEGKLKGAMYGYIAGHHLYIVCERGLVVVDIDEPTQPKIVGEYTGNFITQPSHIQVQFRYAFVTDKEGLKILDISDPVKPRPVRGAVVPFQKAYRTYVARTYAYVAAGPQGLAIVDITNPENPVIDQMFTDEGKINDLHDVKIGSVNASMYALLADGKNGFKVAQLISPDTVPGHMGFSPKPAPRIISWYKTKGPAYAISRGLDRDRVVDETGNQTVVFGRRGSRPFHLDEMQMFYRQGMSSYEREKGTAKPGDFYYVEDLSNDTHDRSELKTKSGKVISLPESP
jgi:cytochrome c551/c552